MVNSHPARRRGQGSRSDPRSGLGLEGAGAEDSLRHASEMNLMWFSQHGTAAPLAAYRAPGERAIELCAMRVPELGQSAVPDLRLAQHFAPTKANKVLRFVLNKRANPTQS